METAGPESGLRLVSWNVNGIRARGKQLRPTLLSLGAHIICLQETRVSRDLLEEDVAILEGFNSYFSHSRTRTGYSGVATYCTDDVAPFAAEEGLSGVLSGSGAPFPLGLTDQFSDQELRQLDSEGRALITKHRLRLSEEGERTLAVINVYVPRADPDNQQRLQFKLRFCQLLQARAEALLRDGEIVLVLGDLNISHRPIDHCQPGDLDEFAAQPGRRWLDGFVCQEEGTGGRLFIDTFRLFHPGRLEAYSCWQTSTGARETNYGTRIDYVLAGGPQARRWLGGCDLLTEVQGSDHCPVRAWLRARCLPAAGLPPLCTKHLPEFAGVQQTLSRFLVALPRPDHGPPSPLASGEEGAVFRLGAGANSHPNEGAKSGQGAGAGAKPRPAIGGRRGKKVNGRPCPSGNLLAYFKPADGEGAGSRSVSPLPSSSPTGASEGVAPPPADFWKGLLRGRPPPPACPGHGEPCVLRTVKKAGPNRGRGFYSCRRPPGPPHNPASRCGFFRWADSSG
ncbi:DNA-(apurinic or apyrimidinic site) lyase 2 [Hypanus sabinus]|uniref:DNA-(apurinic or apyrimidinic site) lyase 2 n=1 Tax=Hypanus sabinus TaxID=79690 RepID=UPI0028C4357C|nr:DNA-(apurinic or apyrimidinic site) lyase 2 [Hypanus sabinus]XP_059813609.1 DNA-(apurinic or apyrimidinic site) lyase 2 [Hypanus sabinus]